MPYKNYIYEYYAKISSGEIIVGKWIKKIFEINKVDAIYIGFIDNDEVFVIIKEILKYLLTLLTNEK